MRFYQKIPAELRASKKLVRHLSISFILLLILTSLMGYLLIYKGFQSLEKVQLAADISKVHSNSNYQFFYYKHLM